jgi:hypothetical protein
MINSVLFIVDNLRLFYYRHPVFDCHKIFESTSVLAKHIRYAFHRAGTQIAILYVHSQVMEVFYSVYATSLLHVNFTTYTATDPLSVE